MLLALLTLLSCAARSVGGDPLRASADALGWTRETGMDAEGEVVTWCESPDPTVGCAILGLRTGSAWRRWSATRWEAAELPADGWGGHLWVEGDDWGLDLRRQVGGKQTDELHLGRRMTLTVEITDVVADGGAFADFTDPRTVGNAVCGRVTTLVGAALAELDAGRVQRCHYGRYLGDSSVECRPVPLPAAEVGPWKRELEDQRDRQCAQAKADGAELAALMRRLWPR